MHLNVEIPTFEVEVRSNTISLSLSLVPKYNRIHGTSVPRARGGVYTFVAARDFLSRKLLVYQMHKVPRRVNGIAAWLVVLRGRLR